MTVALLLSAAAAAGAAWGEEEEEEGRGWYEVIGDEGEGLGLGGWVAFGW